MSTINREPYQCVTKRKRHLMAKWITMTIFHNNLSSFNRLKTVSVWFHPWPRSACQEKAKFSCEKRWWHFGLTLKKVTSQRFCHLCSHVCKTLRQIQMEALSHELNPMCSDFPLWWAVEAEADWLRGRFPRWTPWTCRVMTNMCSTVNEKALTALVNALAHF